MRAARRGPWATPAPPPTPPPPLPPPTPPPLLPLLLLLLAALRPARAAAATGAPEAPPDRGAPQTGRLSLQDTAEIQRCLVNAGDVGCGVFECFENNSCEIRGLQGICLTFLHNAGKFDAQGKSFIKDALKCKAHALRHRFSCISRKCPAIKDMVFQLQRECYLKHDLCAAAQNNIRVIVEVIHFKDLLLQEPYVDLVNLLLTCGEEVREAVARSVQAQCEHDWGGLCAILSFCTSTVQRPPTAPPDGHALGARARLSRTRQDAAGSSGDPGDPGDPGHRARPHPAGGPASHSREAEDSDLGR